MNWNKLEQLRRQEGFKNPEDVFDLTSWDDIRREVGEQQSSIREYINPELREGQIELLEEVREFMSETTESYRDAFVAMLDDYNETKQKVPKAIREYLEQKGMVLPSFIVADTDNADALLEQWGLDHHIMKSENFLVNFQLPKLLA